MRLTRTPQLQGRFVPGDPLSGYYNDLTPEVRSATPAEGEERLRALVGLPNVNMTTVVQLGLASWQLGLEQPGWLDVTAKVAEWLEERMDPDGGLPFLWDMPHTYELPAPWLSSIVQGEAVSLFVRAGLLEAAERAARPLLGPSPIVAETPEGPVLEEYPTTPPSHVLNGWIFGLFGLYDLSIAADRATSGVEDGVAVRAANAFRDGHAALAARLHLYDTGGWSRYDLFPHPLSHVASPFYHRLHVELLRALDLLAPDERLRAFADRWEASGRSTMHRAVAVARKGAFRVARPRRSPGAPQTVKR